LTACGTGAVCLDVNGAPYSYGYCFDTCGGGSDRCRTGYRCTRIATGLSVCQPT
jgi:hypothetical protein